MPDYAAEFEAAAAEARRLTDDLTDEQFNWRPGPHRWSIAECLSHLTQTATCYLPVLQTAVERGEEHDLRGAGPYRLGWFGGWFARAMEPPPKRRFRAPGAVVPNSAGPRDVACSAYCYRNAAVAQLARRASGLDLGRVRMRSPLIPLMRFSLAAGFSILAAHERRHLWQAKQVAKEPGFPQR